MISRLRGSVSRAAVAALRHHPQAPAACSSAVTLRHLLPSNQLLFSSAHSTSSGTIREDRKTLVGRLGHVSMRPWGSIGARAVFLGAPLPPALTRTPLGVSSRLIRSPSTMQVYLYSSRRNPWQSNSDWVTTAKTGAFVLLGAGALVASTSLAFGLIIAGAAGYGVYSLYQKIFGPYRSDPFRDPFSRVNADIDTLNDLFGRQKQQQQRRPAGEAGLGQRELDSLVQGMPLVVRGLVKTIFSFVGKAMQGSMQRAGELRRLTNEHLQSHPRIVSELGSGVSVSTPQQWMESTVDGVGRIEAVFPVSGAYSAHVTVKASVGVGGGVNLKEATYRNRQTGKVIDLLRDGGSAGGSRKTVIDAEYVEIDDRSRSSRW